MPNPKSSFGQRRRSKHCATPQKYNTPSLFDVFSFCDSPLLDSSFLRTTRMKNSNSAKRQAVFFQ
jgi:hypothetical protein